MVPGELPEEVSGKRRHADPADESVRDPLWKQVHVQSLVSRRVDDARTRWIGAGICSREPSLLQVRRSTPASRQSDVPTPPHTPASRLNPVSARKRSLLGRGARLSKAVVRLFGVPRVRISPPPLIRSKLRTGTGLSGT